MSTLFESGGILTVKQDDDETDYFNDKYEVDAVANIDFIVDNSKLEQLGQVQAIVANMLWNMIGILRIRLRKKEPTHMSYTDIMREIDYSKDRENQNIMQHFKQMSKQERDVEVAQRKLHLGKFYVDAKKLNKYGKSTSLFGEEDEELGDDGVGEDVDDMIDDENLDNIYNGMISKNTDNGVDEDDFDDSFDNIPDSDTALNQLDDDEAQFNTYDEDDASDIFENVGDN